MFNFLKNKFRSGKPVDSTKVLFCNLYHIYNMYIYYSDSSDFFNQYFSEFLVYICTNARYDLKSHKYETNNRHN